MTFQSSHWNVKALLHTGSLSDASTPPYYVFQIQQFRLSYYYWWVMAIEQPLQNIEGKKIFRNTMEMYGSFCSAFDLLLLLLLYSHTRAYEARCYWHQISIYYSMPSSVQLTSVMPNQKQSEFFFRLNFKLYLSDLEWCINANRSHTTCVSRITFRNRMEIDSNQNKYNRHVDI